MKSHIWDHTMGVFNIRQKSLSLYLPQSHRHSPFWKSPKKYCNEINWLNASWFAKLKLTVMGMIPWSRPFTIQMTLLFVGWLFFSSGNVGYLLRYPRRKVLGRYSTNAKKIRYSWIPRAQLFPWLLYSILSHASHWYSPKNSINHLSNHTFLHM